MNRKIYLNLGRNDIGKKHSFPEIRHCERLHSA